MSLQKANLIYFSATGTTAQIVSAIGSGLGILEKSIYNLATSSSQQESIIIPDNEITIFGIPVFSGRVPDIAKKKLNRIKGNHSPAILVCVYGNRDFEDALLELNDIVESNGFYVLSAGAFIGQHSIFPKVASGRPDNSDLSIAKKLGTESIQIMNTSSLNQPLIIKGNRPYRTVKPIPLHPRTKPSCNSCGLCAKQCPTQAIDFQNPKKINKNKCISCAHCIAICPKHSKNFGGILYWLASKKFIKNYSERKEPYLIYR